MAPAVVFAGIGQLSQLYMQRRALAVCRAQAACSAEVWLAALCTHMQLPASWTSCKCQLVKEEMRSDTGDQAYLQVDVSCRWCEFILYMRVYGNSTPLLTALQLHGRCSRCCQPV